MHFVVEFSTAFRYIHDLFSGNSVNNDNFGNSFKQMNDHRSNLLNLSS